MVNRLRVRIPTDRGPVCPVDGVSFTLERGKTLGLVGESGCGKTVLCRAILGLLPKGTMLSKDAEIIFDGQLLNRLPERGLNKIRGREVAMIFQDPMTALNPVMTVGRQLSEPLVHHLGMTAKDAKRKATQLMAATGIPNAEQRARLYPHQLSGGLRQRIAIAMALACEPRLLIADEPTTALDATIQADILDLLSFLHNEKRMAMILITHDLRMAAARTQNIAVMYAGKIVETATTGELFANMRMPYTRALFNAIPRIGNPTHRVLKTIVGQPPNPIDPPQGCRFSPRCLYASLKCKAEEPPLLPEDPLAHRTACWHPLT